MSDAQNKVRFRHVCLFTVLTTLWLPIESYGSQQIDVTDLKRIQSSVESFLTQFQTLDVTYDCFVTPNSASTFSTAIQESDAKRLKDKIDKSTNPRTKQALQEMLESSQARNLLQHCILKDAFPSLHACYLDVVTIQQSNNREIKHETMVVNQKVFAYIEHGVNRRALLKSNVSSKDLLFFSEIPTGLVGLAMPARTSFPLSNILEFPAITSVEGREAVGDYETLVLKIGPFSEPIPESLRGTRLHANGYFKIWLAPLLNHLAVRVEIHNYLPRKDGYTKSIKRDKTPENEYVNVLSFNDFKDVTDAVRNKKYKFPHKITFHDQINSRTYQIKTMAVNRGTSNSDYRIEIPAGYVVTKDNASPTLYGGPEARRQILEKSAAVANHYLHHAGVNRNTYRSWYNVAIFSVLASASIVGAYFIFRRRKNRASH